MTQTDMAMDPTCKNGPCCGLSGMPSEVFPGWPIERERERERERESKT